MARFIYMHLGDDIPKRIEKEYNKMLRREKYLEERDAEFMAQSTDYDRVLEAIPDPASLPINLLRRTGEEKTHGLTICPSLWRNCVSIFRRDIM